MSIRPIVFEQKGHPTIILFEDKISIKAIDYWDFKDFFFNKISSIKFYRPFDNSFIGLLCTVGFPGNKYRKDDNYVLRINLEDGEHWDYEVTGSFDGEFVDLIEIIQNKLDIK